MRVSVVFPNSLCLPNPMYHSLPLLAAALKNAGHEPRIYDLNAMAADLFLNRQRSEMILHGARQLIEQLRHQGQGGEADRLTEMLAQLEEKVLDGENCKHILRDRVRCFDQPLFKKAFWTVVDVLGFYYQLDPVISPHRENFGADMIAQQVADPWSPVRDLYEEVFLDSVLQDAPEMIAISVAFPEQAVEAVRLARLLRARKPSLHISMGGPLISLYLDKWLTNNWIFEFTDTICFGDGETAIVELVAALEGHAKLEDARNFIYLNANKELIRTTETAYLEPMDDLPIPDFDTADMDLYLTPGPVYPLMISRGCYWGKCTFCSIGWRENYRQSSSDKIRADVKDLAERYGARYIYMQDSSIPPNGAKNLAQIVKDENLEVHWGGGMKFEKALLNPEYCQLLGEGGCKSLLMGFESANQDVLNLMEKGYDLNDLPQMLKNLRKAGVSAELLWFIGFPTEDRQDVMNTAKFLFDHRADFGLTAFVGDFLLHPDTEVFKNPEHYGVTILSQDNDHCEYVVSTGMQPDEVQQLKNMLSVNNNRTLVCNGGHLPHLVESGMDLSGLERPMTIKPEVVEFCRQE